jgi:hypothetical protein
MERRDHRSSFADRAKTADKEAFEEPTLTYLKPELRVIGKVEELTQQFFGTFSP